MEDKHSSHQSSPEIEKSLQWILDDLFNNKEPNPDDLKAMPIGALTTISKLLTEAWREKGEIGVKKQFASLAKTYPWLGELKNKTVPPRAGTDEQVDPRFKTGKTGKPIIVRLSEDDIMLLPDKEYLIKKVLEKGTVSMLYGEAGTGKTFNALHIAYCVAHGIDWFGRQSSQGKVWYINTEGARGLKPRTAAWRKEYEVKKTSNIEFITWPVQLKDHSQLLLDTIEEADEKPILLIIDNYSMCAAGTNQNDQMVVTETLMVLHKIAQTYGCHCLLVHHTTWQKKVNGSMAFKNHVDEMLDLSRADKESPIVLHSEKTRDDEGFPDIYLELKTITAYAHPETGEFITSCVVVTTEAPPKEDTISKNTSEKKMYYLLVGKSLTYTEWWEQGVELGIGKERTVKGYIAALERAGKVQKEGTGKGAKYSTARRDEQTAKRQSFSISDNMLDVLKRMEQEKEQGIAKDDWMQEYALEWKFEVDGIKNMFGRTIDTLLMNNEICCSSGLYSTARKDGDD